MYWLIGFIGAAFLLCVLEPLIAMYYVDVMTKPTPNQANKKATVRFKDGVEIGFYIPSNAGDDMRNKVVGFQFMNQDEEARAAMHRARRQARNAGIGGQYGNSTAIGDSND